MTRSMPPPLQMMTRSDLRASWQVPTSSGHGGSQPWILVPTRELHSSTMQCHMTASLLVQLPVAARLPTSGARVQRTGGAPSTMKAWMMQRGRHGFHSTQRQAASRPHWQSQGRWWISWVVPEPGLRWLEVLMWWRRCPCPGGQACGACFPAPRTVAASAHAPPDVPLECAS